MTWTPPSTRRRPPATGWWAESASTRALGGWPTSEAPRGSSLRLPSPSADRTSSHAHEASLPKRLDWPSGSKRTDDDTPAPPLPARSGRLSGVAMTATAAQGEPRPHDHAAAHDDHHHDHDDDGHQRSAHHDDPPTRAAGFMG